MKILLQISEVVAIFLQHVISFWRVYFKVLGTGYTKARSDNINGHFLQILKMSENWTHTIAIPMPKADQNGPGTSHSRFLK